MEVRDEVSFSLRTYNYAYYDRLGQANDHPEFGPPESRVTIRHEDAAVRLILGCAGKILENRGHSPCPDVHVEKWPDRWVITVWRYGNGEDDLEVHIPMTKDRRQLIIRPLQNRDLWIDHSLAGELDYDSATRPTPADAIDWRPEAGIEDE
jgi:hypothetical protein